MASIEIDGVNGVIKNTTSDADIFIKGNDGGSEITALTFDISAAGAATFNDKITAVGTSVFTNLDISGDIDVDGTTNLDVVDIDGAVDMASTLQVDGAITSSAGATITTADNTDTLTLTSTDADASSGPNLRMYRNSSSPADSDILGVLEYEGRNDNSEDIRYVQISSLADDVSDGTEDGSYFISTMHGGTLRNRMNVRPGEVVFNEESQDINFRVESDGNPNMLYVDGGRNEVVIGTSNDQSAKLAVFQEQTDHRSLQVEANTSSYASDVMDIGCTRNTNDDTYRFLTMQRRGFVQVFKVTDAGNVQNINNSYGSTSDERIKTDITDSGSQWDDIKAIKVKKFKLGFGGDYSTKLGVIAQDLEAAGMNGLVEERNANEYEIKHNSVFGSLYEDGDDIPEGKKVGEIKETKEKVKEVKYSILYMKAIKALQEAMAKIETLETKVKALEDA